MQFSHAAVSDPSGCEITFFYFFFLLFLLPRYYLHRNDRKKGGGGVLLFVSSKILSKRVTFDRCYKTIEPLALEIGLKSRNAIILVIYRPPKKLTGKYRLLLEEELSHIAN